MVASIISRMAIVVCGILYPAYSSFKAVRRKSHRDYTKWMMYWIVFALFQAVEMITDTFLPWLPLYYELKILFVLWLVLPITEGSKQMYRLIIHPFLLRHEEKIDRGISQAGQTGLDTLRRMSQAGLNKAATTVVSSAIMGQNVLTETLLRAQERQRTNQQGTDQPDLQEVPADSSEQRGDGVGNQRDRVSSASSDFEPFEVIDGEVEALRHPDNQPSHPDDQRPSSGNAFWEESSENQPPPGRSHMWSTSSSNSTNSNNNNGNSSDNVGGTPAFQSEDRAVPQGKESDLLAVHDHQS